MAIKEIPAKTLYVCDCCGAEVESEKARSPLDWGKFEFHEVGYDPQGYAVGGVQRNYILCQSCCVGVRKLIEAMFR